MQKVICMAKIKFQQQDAKNKQKILNDIYIYIYIYIYIGFHVNSTNSPKWLEFNFMI
jgi:hypothetical protein